MAKQNFKLYVPREAPKKRKGIHKKSKNKAEKKQKSMKRYRGQG
jgi:hypothetical protein